MNKVIQMLLVLSGIGIISGGLLAAVSNWANPFIIANKKAETEAAIFRVLEGGSVYEPVNNAGFELFQVSNNDNEKIGYAVVYEGNGFQGKVRIIFGLTTDLNNITAIEILDQVETPGLGTKITEPPFTEQFKQLQVNPKIEWVKGVEPEKPNEIQAITGATISSKAVVAIINEGVQQMRKLREAGRLQ